MTDEPESQESEGLGRVCQKLTSLKLKKQSGFYRDEKNVLIDFLNNFNTANLNPIAAFDYLRKYGNVHFLPANKKWLVLAYDDVEYILKNPEIFSSAGYDLLDPYLLGADPGLHHINRSLLQPLFSTKIIEGLGEFAKAKSVELLNRLLLQEEFDAVRDFSEPLTEQILLYFFGLSDQEAIAMKNQLGDKDETYLQKLADFFGDTLKRTDVWPKDKVLSKIKTFVDEGTLTFQAAKSILRLLWCAGIHTTATFTCTVMRYLFDSDNFASKVELEHKLIPKFITEVLRLAPPSNYIHRTTTSPVELGGKLIPANAKLMLSTESANRDPEHFLNPNSLLLDRPAKRNFSFGANIHQCIGMSMSKAIINEVIMSALDRTDDFDKYKISGPSYFQDIEMKFVTELKFTRKKLDISYASGDTDI